MLNLTADTAGDIYLRMHGDTRLTNLTVVVDPSGIYSGTRATYLAVKHLGQLEELVESFLRTYTISTGNNNGRTLEVVLGSFYVMVEHLNHVSLSRYILRHLGINNLALGIALVDSLLHHA